MRRDRVVRGVLGDDAAITPSEMCNQQFTRVLVGGYSPSEVDTYLERAADQLEALIGQVRILKERQEEQKARLEEYRQMEATLRSALVSSQKFGEEIIGAAKREADAVIQEARAKGAHAHEEATRLSEGLAEEIRLLEQQRRRLRTELLTILETHRNLLDALIPEKETAAPSTRVEAHEPSVAADSADETPAGYDSEAEIPDEGGGVPDEDDPVVSEKRDLAAYEGRADTWTETNSEYELTEPTDGSASGDDIAQTSEEETVL